MLWLTRHGETVFNRASRFQGQLDSDLTDKGRAQANALGDRLKSLLGDQKVTLCASPLGRAQVTAKIINTHLNAGEIIADPRLAEIGLGDWEGMTMEDIEYTHPGVLDGSTRYDWAFRAPGGETEAAFRARLKSWLSDIEKADTPVIAVSHGWAGMGLRSLYTGRSFEQVSAMGNSHETIFHFSHGEVMEV